MEMQPPSNLGPAAAAGDDVPEVVDQQMYKEGTHFTPEEVKPAWEPNPEVGSVPACN